MAHSSIIWESEREVAPNFSETEKVAAQYASPEVRDPELVRCFRHEGAECPRCDGTGFRPRKRCAGCGVLAGRPSQGGKALSPERGAKSWKELKSLPLYCMDCSPRFLRTGLVLFEEVDS